MDFRAVFRGDIGRNFWARNPIEFPPCFPLQLRPRRVKAQYNALLVCSSFPNLIGKNDLKKYPEIVRKLALPCHSDAIYPIRLFLTEVEVGQHLGHQVAEECEKVRPQHRQFDFCQERKLCQDEQVQREIVSSPSFSSICMAMTRSSAIL